SLPRTYCQSELGICSDQLRLYYFRLLIRICFGIQCFESSVIDRVERRKCQKCRSSDFNTCTSMSKSRRLQTESCGFNFVVSLWWTSNRRGSKLKSRLESGLNRSVVCK